MTETGLSGAHDAPDMRTQAPPPDARRDLGAALFFTLWAVVGWYAVSGDAYLWSDFGVDPGPSLMPAIVLTLLSAGSFVMLISAILKLRTAGVPYGRSGILAPFLIPFLFICSLVAMVPLMRALGFLPAGALFSAGWMFVLHDASRGRSLARRLLEVGAATAVGIGLIYYVFVRVIHVPLP